MEIRAEAEGDAAGIYAVTQDAFAGAPHSDGTEAQIVAALRAAGALTLSLVAMEASCIVGHIAFSPVTVAGENCRWYGLGPLSVAPARQRNGIGSRLVTAGLAHLQALGARGCVVLGDPDYYSRFGFAADARLYYPGVPAAYFQARSFDGTLPTGAVAYHAGFTAS